MTGFSKIRSSRRAFCSAIAGTLLALAQALPAWAMPCHRDGDLVRCDDGRVGQFAGDAIVWSDGTRSRLAPPQSVIIGHKDSVQVGPGVFVGQGGGMVPLDNPSSPNKRDCAVLDGVSYCY